MSVRIQLRRDTAANWTATNPTLTQGEPGYETDTGKIKYGDGSTAWNSLPYAPASAIADGTIVDADVNASAAIAGTKISPDFGSQNVTTTGTSTAASFTPTSSTVPTNGVYLPAANSVALSTNGTGRLFVDASGNIGLGGASGGNRLFVDGVASNAPALFSSNTTETFIALESSNSTNNFSSRIGTTSDALTFRTLNSERLRITSAGLVGIGTSSPQLLLDLKPSSNVSQLQLTQSNANDGWRFHADGPNGGHLYINRWASSTETTKVTVLNSGNVGIGTTSPGDLFHVSESSASLTAPAAGSVALFERAANTGITLGTANTGSCTLFFADSDSNSVGRLLYDHSTDSLQIYTNGSSERARIDSSGRLLVGTSSTSDNSLIQIQGRSGLSTGPAEFALRKGALPASGDSIAVIKAQDNSGNLGASIVASADANWASGTSHPTRLVFSTTANGASSPTERMRITSTGRATGFTTNDNCLLLANSAAAGTSLALIYGLHTATAVNTGTISFAVYTNGDVQNTNNSYGAYSDVKLKENIVNASSQWDDLKALRVVNYNFKPETGAETHRQLGLIAQEVELVSPGLVSESPDRDEEGNDLGTVTKSVNYSVLYMKAVKALQEAMDRIETLEASNTDLLARVSALESA